MRGHGLLAFAVFCIALLSATLAPVSWGGQAAAARTPRWVTGADFQRRLARRVNVVWSGNPLRKGLRNLSDAQQVAVLIDRRVDPGQKVDLRVHDVRLETVLEEIARNRRLGVSMLGSVVYFGPPRVSAELRTVAALCEEAVDRLPAGIGVKFRRARRMEWDDFATPRELLGQLARDNGLQLVGLDRVPHDLWAGANLPPLSLVNRLTLIAVQFDLTFEVSANGRTLTLAAIPHSVGLVRNYPGGREPKTTAEKFAAIVPDAQIKVVGDQVYVKGLLEEHQRLSSPRPPSLPDTTPRNVASSGTSVEQTLIDKVSFRELPVGGVLEQLAGQLKLDLRIDREGLRQAGISLQQPISVSAENVTVDELLRLVIATTRLKFRRRGTVVEIGPAE